MVESVETASSPIIESFVHRDPDKISPRFCFLITCIVSVCFAVVKIEGSQEASKKKSPSAAPVPRQTALVTNEAAETRLPRKEPVIAGSSKGKEKMEAERPTKRLRPLGEVEISRAEFDGDEILSLYSGDDLVLPCTENALEDVQEELRGFIPQALKLANVVTVQLNKMAMRIKELEAENARAKEVELQLQRQLQAERNFSDGLRRDVHRLERQLRGESVSEQSPEAKLEQLLNEMERVAEVHGTNCDLYRTKQNRLDRMLTAQAEAADEAKRSA